MLKTLITAFAILFAFTINSEARMHPRCNIDWPCIAPYASTPEQARVTRGRFIARSVGIGGPVVKRAVRAPKARQGFFAKSAKKSRQAISGIVAPLAAKVAEIQSVCGSKVISAVRHTYVAGTRRISLHSSGQAVDMAGNPSCIYSLLHGWSGGYSIDYARVRHVHISYGGREHGVRFVHGGHHKRHARRSHHNRYARAGG